MPEPMSKYGLISVLTNILEHVQADDSFEGSIEYLLPESGEDHDFVQDTSSEHPQCRICGLGATDIDTMMHLHKGDPKDADFMVRASYRVGNLQGQGSMRLVGEFGTHSTTDTAGAKTC